MKSPRCDSDAFGKMASLYLSFFLLMAAYQFLGQRPIYAR